MPDRRIQNALLHKVEIENLMEMISQTWNMKGKVFIHIYVIVLIKQ